MAHPRQKVPFKTRESKLLVFCFLIGCCIVVDTSGLKFAHSVEVSVAPKFVEAPSAAHFHTRLTSPPF
eukprot:3010083-Amphidinium_carterae.1